MEFWCMNYSGGSIELDEDVVIRRLRRMCEMKCLYLDEVIFISLTTQIVHT
jgi:hypothetical protein